MTRRWVCSWNRRTSVDLPVPALPVRKRLCPPWSSASASSNSGVRTKLVIACFHKRAGEPVLTVLRNWSCLAHGNSRDAISIAINVTPPLNSVFQRDRVLAAVVIGAGQAGLSAAFHLRRRGLVAGADFVVLDSNAGPGGAWRHRWGSFTFWSGHALLELAGFFRGIH